MRAFLQQRLPHYWYLYDFRLRRRGATDGGRELRPEGGKEPVLLHDTFRAFGRIMNVAPLLSHENCVLYSDDMTANEEALWGTEGAPGAAPSPERCSHSSRRQGSSERLRSEWRSMGRLRLRVLFCCACDRRNLHSHHSPLVCACVPSGVVVGSERLALFI